MPNKHYVRIKEICENRSESRGDTAIKNVSKIQLHDVCFSYSVREPNSQNKNSRETNNDDNLHIYGDSDIFVTKEVISNVNMTFDKYKVYAIAGANGAGKSTIINLIIGLYIDEYSGTILYDNMDIRQIDMVDTRKKHIGFVEQEPLLIKDSIRYNLDLDAKREDSGYVNHCIKVLNMENFISQNTFDYEINEKTPTHPEVKSKKFPS